MLISVDTCVLLDQATGDEDVLDSLRIIRERARNVSFVVTRTVLLELASAVEDGGQKGEDALLALRRLEDWGYQALDVVPVGRGIAEEIGRKLRAKGVIPDEEVNDSEIIAEAALVNCAMLLSSDSHMRDAQNHPAFRDVLRDCDVGEIVIGSPKTIARKFDVRR